ncbi:MAG: hypothetical protein ACE5GW_05770, partial [Planctomycetota bacterium]
LPQGLEHTRIRSFTVGLAASKRGFDQQAFVNLLVHSLKESASRQSFKVTHEPDERQQSKIRGMLVQQYLAAEEIPVTVSNLSFKLQEAGNDFKIGERIVPRGGAQIASATSGGPVFVNHTDPISAVLRRDQRGSYSIAYEELGGGSGSIPISIRDLEILDPEQPPRSARQGDISFNWRLNLEKIHVYRIENFEGDVGRFLSSMRYPGIRTSISRYQTIRDFVFLFGYGNYVTGLVNQILTPSHISGVEVLPIDEGTFDALRGGMSEREVGEILGRSAHWQRCEFVDFSGDQKVWERPAAVGFPFVSRQISEEKGLVFYTKYDSEGALLVGDFERED